MPQSAVFPLNPSFTSEPADSLEAAGRVPDYLLATAGVSPEAAVRLAKLVRVVLFGGTLPASLKLAMGSQITQQCQARYAQAHVQRLAKAVGGSDPRTALAVRYATDLTRDVHGVSDETFNLVNTRFNDAQVIELTMVTCFFNYFARLTIGLGVTPEPWLATTAPKPPVQSISELTVARVALASDAELAMGSSLLERAKNPAASGLGIAIANSQRAMVRVPDLHEAWMGGGGTPRPAGSPAPPAIVPRTTMLQVSLAVSQANGCRYCVLHQVQGLRRQGVEVGKLLALQKSDAALSPDEKAAVDFARKLTKTPGALTEADRLALQKSFPGPAAFEVLHQTCRFAFMNRFTDGLRLPSEDEAVKTYREVYGQDFPEKRKN
ncbi:carboxymuconolactone decarboxylase family protein [Armatimonas rosea]|uniref:AhpD family alkylhydroperoxidase n=1 Tax=Armatimonas rosea TaxID=685828 RepID=A0A7W9SUP9_ARMRO|nr:carboxymuconolactone decarboxylase family protein [Armatimonas rosea]MBB6052569.1 AhpD family alkylhydroperoxidase [Armatimonas rosea]